MAPMSMPLSRELPEVSRKGEAMNAGRAINRSDFTRIRVIRMYTHFTFHYYALKCNA